jgi:hypothetical protein
MLAPPSELNGEEPQSEIEILLPQQYVGKIGVTGQELAEVLRNGLVVNWVGGKAS